MTEVLFSNTDRWRDGSSRAISLIVVAGVLRLVDIAIIGAAGIVAYSAYMGEDANYKAIYYLAVLVGALLATVIFHVNQLYRINSGAVVTSSARLFSSVSAVMLTLVVLAHLLHISELYSRVWVALWFVTSFVGMSLARIGLRALQKRWMLEGRLTRVVAIVGSGSHASRLVRRFNLAGQPGVSALGVKVVGYFDDRSGRADPELAKIGCSRLGTVEDLLVFARKQPLDHVIVALPWSAETRVLQLLRKLRALPVDVALAPDLVGFTLNRSAYSSLGGVVLLPVFSAPLADWRLVMKDIEDRGLALLLLVLFGPLLVMISLLIKLDSKGPLLFRQQRYGFNNQLIKVLKFRTMYTHLEDRDATRLATRDDPRVTRVGRWLRRTSLDELPQLVNVLRGEMSIVGPRPHALSAKAADRLYEDVVEEYAARHRVKPGITGWAQVHGWRGETDTYDKIRKRVEYDLYYIEHWSLALDIKILVMTAIAVFRTKNAY
ncbi:MAG TPA: undecaprenyl-phosphate glucose phosphotransferase [Stellaceae bacterium]|nr:undecaprenyl-phosphate glucose phosphotransferase [Stellaceae bacterium]